MSPTQNPTAAGPQRAAEAAVGQAAALQATDEATVRRFVAGLPKAELHLHIEGTLEPEMLFALAERNGRPLDKYRTVEELRRAYDFTSLQSFLDVYYEGMAVLLTEADYFELAMAYFTRAAADGVRHAEVMFDPQGHTGRGVGLATVVAGLARAAAEAEARLGMTVLLILSFLRHLPEADALATLEAAEPFRGHFIAVGLDSSEVGHPPAKFAKAFEEARRRGFKAVAHGGEEGSADPYITDAIGLLHIDRLDHGIRCLEDPALVVKLRESRMGLTVCPLSNFRLRTVDTLAAHPMRRLLDAGLVASINSDDPAYFGGYINENYVQTALATGMTLEHLRLAASHSIESSFAPASRKAALMQELRRYVDEFVADGRA